jgi:hypothetical protein
MKYEWGWKKRRTSIVNYSFEAALIRFFAPQPQIMSARDAFPLKFRSDYQIITVIQFGSCHVERRNKKNVCVAAAARDECAIIIFLNAALAVNQ